MSEMLVDQEDEGPVRCGNCNWAGLVKDCKDIPDYFERIEPGGETPAGECPECGALCYLLARLQVEVEVKGGMVQEVRVRQKNYHPPFDLKVIDHDVPEEE